MQMILPLLPTVKQVLFPNTTLRIPLALHGDAEQVFAMHRTCAVFQTKETVEDCFDYGCTGVIIDNEMDYNKMWLTVKGLQIIKLQGYLSIGYNYPFVSAGVSPEHNLNAFGPLFANTISQKLALAALNRHESITSTGHAMPEGEGDPSSILTCMLPLSEREKQFMLESDNRQRELMLTMWLRDPNCGSILH